ncbi:MAG TPA: glycogen/starch synthase [Candidatus Sulfotelmatobacter sp.]|nr:glycogen/starch synthase [Candidatus Sulfotelmatobacter sp.]
MNVLFVVWENDPFFKIGGLGDIARSLPGALKTLNIDTRVIIPYYKVVKFGRSKKTKIAVLDLIYAGKKEKVEIWQSFNPYTNVIAYFLKNKKYLDIAIPMDTWGFFDKAVVEVIKSNVLNWKIDIVHVNDWHCGLIPLLIKIEKLPIKTMLTIHNLFHQGKSNIDIVKKMGIDPRLSKTLSWEIKDKQVNFLLEAIVHADVITTVSPTYAKEMLTEEYGYGLHEILKGREGEIYGILNGIDIDWRHTTRDPAVRFPYGPKEKLVDGKIEYYNWKEGKLLDKKFLQKKLGLKVDKNIPMICFIGRLVEAQKGIEILHTMIRRIDQTKYQFVILGTGDKDWEERFKWFSTFYPKYISTIFRFDDPLAHQIYAASDFIVIPSKFEPCGLIQMIAMLFGTIPIAHKTGGLKDSIKDGFNGFLFSNYSSEALEERVMKAVDIWKNDRPKYEQMVENALATDFSWKKNAEEYLKLYEKLLENKSS